MLSDDVEPIILTQTLSEAAASEFDLIWPTCFAWTSMTQTGVNTFKLSGYRVHAGLESSFLHVKLLCFWTHVMCFHNFGPSSPSLFPQLPMCRLPWIMKNIESAWKNNMEDFVQMMVNWVQKIKNTYDTLILVWEISRNHLNISCSNFKRYVHVKSWKQTQVQAPVTQAKVCQAYSTHKSGLGSRGQHLEQSTIRKRKHLSNTSNCKIGT